MKKSSFKKPFVNLADIDEAIGPDGWKRVAKKVADPSFSGGKPKRDKMKALADLLMREYGQALSPPKASSYKVTNWVR